MWSCGYILSTGCWIEASVHAVGRESCSDTYPSQARSTCPTSYPCPASNADSICATPTVCVLYWGIWAVSLANLEDGFVTLTDCASLSGCDRELSEKKQKCQGIPTRVFVERLQMHMFSEDQRATDVCKFHINTTERPNTLQYGRHHAFRCQSSYSQRQCSSVCPPHKDVNITGGPQASVQIGRLASHFCMNVGLEGLNTRDR